MAKEKKEEPKREEKSSRPKKHLHSIRTEVVRDHKGKVTGYVSHHTYKAHPTDHHTEPEKPMAVHDTAEEAGEHVAEQGQMAEGMGGAQPEEQEAGGAAEPGAAGAEPAGA